MSRSSSPLAVAAPGAASPAEPVTVEGLLRQLQAERAAREEMERRLEIRERQIADVEEAAGLGMWEWQTESNVIRWTRGQLRLHGIDQSRHPNSFEDFLALVHPEDRELVVRECDALARTGEPFAFPYRVVRPDGAVRWLLAHGKMVLDECAGRRMVGTSQDITARKEAEEALRASEESYRTIFDLSTEPIFVHDPDTGAVLDANQRACEMHGITLEELKSGGIGSVSDRVAGFDGEGARALVRRAAAGEPQHFEWRGIRKPDQPLWVEVSLNRVTILGETRVLASVRDITLRKLAEEGLQRAYAELEQRVQERTAELAVANRALESEIAEHRVAREELLQRTVELEGLFRALPDVYLKANPEGRVTDFRLGSEAALYPLPNGFPKQLVGTNPLEYMPPEPARMWHEAVEEARRSGRVVCTEYPLPVEGGMRDFEVRLAPLPDGGTVAVIRDITERKLGEIALAQAKEEAEQAREAAERANRAKSEFLSRMSHELRTPMNSILGFAQVLERAPLDARQGKSVQHILRAGRHLLQLINEVLEISRIEAGRPNLSLEPVRIGQVLHEALSLVRPLAAQWGVELVEPEEYPTTFVEADRQRLTQVLLNLLSNAIKYNRVAGRVRLSCGGVVASPAGPRLLLRIRDTGRGIPEERVHELFTPFARLGAEQSQVEGTGLGLALSQRLTEAMGGELRLESTSPEGSTFLLELNVVASPLQRLEEGDGSGACDDGAPHAPATLLYIEDNLANLSLLETILDARPRWRMLSALQGQIGIELAQEHVPDVVLLDLHLPDIAGDEVLRRLRADPRTAEIPVVIISADATRATVDRLLAKGAAAFLTKPLDVDEFLRTVGELVPQP